MPKKYTLAYDGSCNRIDFTMTGQWDASDAASWRTEYTATVNGASAGFVVVGDLLGSALQSPEIQATHEELMGYSIQKGMARAALIVSAATLKMQLQRLASTSDTDNKIIFVGSKEQAEQVVRQVAAARP